MVAEGGEEKKSIGLEEVVKSVKDQKVLPKEYLIVATETEETAVQLLFFSDATETGPGSEKCAAATIELFKMDSDKINNTAWIRTSLLFDVPSIGERVRISHEIRRVASILLRDEANVQVKHRGTYGGSKEINTAMPFKVEVVHYNDFKRTASSSPRLQGGGGAAEYEDISPNVFHIDANWEFHSVKPSSDPHKRTEENLFNLDDVVVHFTDGDADSTDNGPISIQGSQHSNIRASSAASVVQAMKEMPELSESDRDLVLVVDNGFEAAAFDVVHRYSSLVSLVVCDTFNSPSQRDAMRLLGLCKERRVTCIRGGARHGLFNLNLGHGTDADGGDLVAPDTFQGLITYHPVASSYTERFAFILCVDPRMAQLTQLVLHMEDAAEVSTVVVDHAIDDFAVRHLEDYKVFPHFQTDQFNSLAQLCKHRNIHNVIAFITPFAGIASMLVDCGIFATCRMTTMDTYLSNIRKLAASRRAESAAASAPETTTQQQQLLMDEQAQPDVVQEDQEQEQEQEQESRVMTDITEEEEEEGTAAVAAALSSLDLQQHE